MYFIFLQDKNLFQNYKKNKFILYICHGKNKFFVSSAFIFFQENEVGSPSVQRFVRK